MATHPLFQQATNEPGMYGQSIRVSSSLSGNFALIRGEASELVESILSVHQGGRGWIALSCFVQGKEEVHFMKPEDLAQQGTGEAFMEDFERNDLFFSICRYFGEDRTSPVAGISAVCAQLKVPEQGTTALPWQQGKTPDEYASALLVHLPQVGLGGTKPSIFWTGNGLLLTWRLEHLPGSAEPRWRALQKNLAQRLLCVGADPNEIDIRMSLRAAGSWNSAENILDEHRRSRVLVRGGTHIFDQLCDTLLPIRRDELRRRRGRSASKCAGAASLWRDRLADMQAWILGTWPKGLPIGFRENVLWLAAIAIAWSARDPNDVAAAVHEIAEMVAPFATPAEIDQWTSSVCERLSRDFAGQRERYRFTDEELTDELCRGLGSVERNAWEEIAAKSLSKRQIRRGIKSGRVRQLKRIDRQTEAKKLHHESKKSYSEIGALLNVSKSTAWRLVWE